MGALDLVREEVVLKIICFELVVRLQPFPMLQLILHTMALVIRCRYAVGSKTLVCRDALDLVDVKVTAVAHDDGTGILAAVPGFTEAGADLLLLPWAGQTATLQVHPDGREAPAAKILYTSRPNHGVSAVDLKAVPPIEPRVAMIVSPFLVDVDKVVDVPPRVVERHEVQCRTCLHRRHLTGLLVAVFILNGLTITRVTAMGGGRGVTQARS